MLRPSIALLSLALITASACSPLRRQSGPVEITSTGAVYGSRWNAILATPATLRGAIEIHGTAWMAPDSGRTLVSATISNASPGGIHPWQVRHGRCGSNGQLLGPADAYTPLRVRGDGTATAQATVELSLPSSGDYSVIVYAAPSNMSTVIACGNFAPPIQ